jgi:EAL domain-containing protein (putative c-di-GMP-specific phosphodiesterase class I)
MSAENELLAFWRRQIKDPGRHVAIVVELSALYALHQSQRQFRIQHSMVRELAQRNAAKYFPMSNGDAVLTLRRDRDNAGETMAAELLDWILADALISGDMISRRVALFKLPEQTGELRELIARYLRDAEAPSETGMLAGQGLVPEPTESGLKGRLAPSMIERLEYRIMRSDIRSFVDNQSVFAKPKSRAGAWVPSIQERRINLTSLRDALFPQVEIASTNPLFGQLCRILDERMLHHLMSGRPRFDRQISVNICIDTIFDRVFDTFLLHVEDESRRNLFIEVQCAEIFQDITRAVAALTRLRQHGLGIIIDGMSIEFLPYVRIDKLDHDYLKIMLPRETVKLLTSDSRIRAVRKLPPGRIILSRCDHAAAIRIGETLGITMYQGWFLDEYTGAPMLED